MRIITRKRLRDFAEKHPATRSAIEEFLKYTKRKEVHWDMPQDVVNTYGSERVDILGNDRVCIDIAGNDVRLILKVDYGFGRCFVRWVGLHKDYDKLKDIEKI